MSTFIPDLPKKAACVPYYEDANAAGGWAGQSTTKTMEMLKIEISLAINRLGGFVSGFQKGSFIIDNKERMGFRVTYSIVDANGTARPGMIEIAALPVKAYPAMSYEARCEKALRMALFMLRDSFDGLWFMQQLSPGYAPLMPFMLTEGGETLTQLWSKNTMMKNLLPPGEEEFIEGEATILNQESHHAK